MRRRALSGALVTRLLLVTPAHIHMQRIAWCAAVIRLAHAYMMTKHTTAVLQHRDTTGGLPASMPELLSCAYRWRPFSCRLPVLSCSRVPLCLCVWDRHIYDAVCVPMRGLVATQTRIAATQHMPSVGKTAVLAHTAYRARCTGTYRYVPV